MVSDGVKILIQVFLVLKFIFRLFYFEKFDIESRLGSLYERDKYDLSEVGELVEDEKIGSYSLFYVIIVSFFSQVLDFFLIL